MRNMRLNIIAIVAENPGITINNIGKAIGIDGRNASNYVYCLEKLGKIRRSGYSSWTTQKIYITDAEVKHKPKPNTKRKNVNFLEGWAGAFELGIASFIDENKNSHMHLSKNIY